MRNSWGTAVFVAVFLAMVGAVAVLISGVAQPIMYKNDRAVECRAAGGSYLRRDDVCLDPNVVITPRDKS